MKTHASNFADDDAAGIEIVGIFIKRLLNSTGVLVRPWTVDANDPEMLLPLHDRQFAKIRVERHEHAMLHMRNREQLRIAGIFRPLGGRDHVVPGRSQFVRQTVREAAIEQQLHVRRRRAACSRRERQTAGKP